MTRYDVVRVICTMAEQIGENLGREEPIQWAYYQFPNGSLVSTPFLIYFYDSNDDFIADNSNYATIDNLVIEFYSASVDFSDEAIIEGILFDNNIVYSKQFSYLTDEEMYLVRYESEILLERN